MSTRAIIGIQNTDGTITAGWQWNDGGGLGPLLRRHYNTIDKIQTLINNGVWSTIITPKDKESLTLFTDWVKRENSGYYIVSAGKCKLLKQKPNDTAKFCFGGDKGITINNDGSMTFDNFETAHGQDINYLYLFNPETNKWKTYWR